jgi:hypothetical protein
MTYRGIARGRIIQLEEPLPFPDGTRVWVDVRLAEAAAITRVAVVSSVLASFGYDHPCATLEVEFTTGKVYRYFEVPADVHRALSEAESFGIYFNKQIRNVYRCEPINDPDVIV